MPHESLRRFDARELRRFLRAVDAELDGTVRVVLVGGSALALGYAVGTSTVGVDTWESDLGRIRGAAARARAATGLDIPIDSAAVGDVPYEYESRLRRVLPRLHRLEVCVPEKHDLALSKVMRCHEGDLAGIEALHRLHGLDEETLVTRYMEEMKHVIGDPGRIDLNLLAAVERVFGVVDAEAVERRLAEWRKDEDSRPLPPGLRSKPRTERSRRTPDIPRRRAASRSGSSPRSRRARAR